MKHELDLEIVRWIGGLGAAGVAHVMARFGIGRSWAYERVTSLVRDDLLVQHYLLVGRPTLYTATRRGLRWGGLRELRPFPVTAGQFEHAWQIADVAAAVNRDLPGWRVWSDREILWHERRQRKLLASAHIGTSSGQGYIGEFHRPDLALLSPRGRVVAIEVELSVKRHSSLVAICNGWARARHVDAVYYLATPPTVGPLSRAVQKTRAEERVKILSLGQTAELVRLERETTGGGGDDDHR